MKTLQLFNHTISLFNGDSAGPYANYSLNNAICWVKIDGGDWMGSNLRGFLRTVESLLYLQTEEEFQEWCTNNLYPFR